MQVRGKSVYLSGRNGVLGNRGIAGTAGDRPHTVQYYVHFSIPILNFFIFKPPATIANSIKMLYS